MTLLFAVTLYSSVNLSWSAMPSLDERFADNPYVTGFPGVRFYAGHPLILSNGCCGRYALYSRRETASL